MAFNEGKGSVKASPMLRAGKRHKGGILEPRRQRKPLTALWQLRVREIWQAKRGRLRYAKKFVASRRARLKRRHLKRQETVRKLEVARHAEIEKMGRREREWNTRLVDSAEKALRPMHTEANGVHYAPSGGLDVRGQLHVPWPLPQRDIPFDDALLEDSDDEGGGMSESEEEEEEEAAAAPAAAAASAPRRSRRLAP